MCFLSGFSILSRLRSTERPRLTSCWLFYVCLIMCPVVLRVARSWVCQFPWSHRFRWSVHLWTAEMISPSWFCGHLSRFLDNNLLFVEFVGQDALAGAIMEGCSVELRERALTQLSFEYLGFGVVKGWGKHQRSCHVDILLIFDLNVAISNFS